MSTYEEKLAELRKKYGRLAAPATAPNTVAPTSQGGTGNSFETRSAAIRQKWGAPTGSAPSASAGVNFAPMDEQQISAPAPAPASPIQPVQQRKLDRLLTEQAGIAAPPAVQPAPVRQFDFATAGAEAGPVRTWRDVEAEKIIRKYAPSQTPEGQAATQTAAEKATKEYLDRLQATKADPSRLATAIVEGRIRPRDLADITPDKFNWDAIAGATYKSQFTGAPTPGTGTIRKIAEQAKGDPATAHQNLMNFLQSREEGKPFQFLRGIREGGTDALTLGFVPQDTIPETTAEKAGNLTGAVLGQLPWIAGAAATGGAAAGAVGRAAGIVNPLAQAAIQAAGTGAAISTAQEAVKGLARPGDFDAGQAARNILSTTAEYAAFGPAYEGLGILGGRIAQRAPGLARAVQAVESVPVVGEAIIGGAKGAIAGGGVGVGKAVLGALTTPEGREAKSFVQTVADNAKQELSEELVEAIAFGIVRKFVPMNASAVLATAQTLQTEAQATAEASPQTTAPTAPAAVPAPSSPATPQPVTTPAPPAPVTPAPSPQAPAIDRANLLRTANPGMDERAILDLVGTTSNLSDEEFQGFAERAGKPEAAPDQTPPLDRVADVRRRFPDLSEAFIQQTAKTEDRLALLREKNPGISDQAARDAVQSGDILSDDEFRQYADLVGRQQETAPAKAQPTAPALTTPTAETAAAPGKPLPTMADNYVKPLSNYSDTLYRETSARAAFPFIKESNATDQGAMSDVFLANTPNLALGQGDNQGILLEFDAGALRGQVNTSKPAWQAAYDQGDAEFIGRNNGAPVYQESLRAVTVKPDVKMPKADKRKLTATLGALEAQGWTKTANPDNSVTYRRPQAAQQPAAAPAPAPAPQPTPQRADNTTVPEATRPVTTGKLATAKTERGTTVETQYAVVDAGGLISSHDTGLRQDARYPQELQPRDRSRIASEDQINRIVGSLEPEFLGASPKASEGAPIVGSDMVVESGNGRVIALKRAYENRHANGAKYKAWLMANADQFGLDPKAIEGTTSPVLVRVRQTEVDRAEFARQANEQSVAAMSATEQAMSDATKLEGGWMVLFNPTDSGEIVHPGNRDFIRMFMDKVMGPTERGRYLTADGALSQEGINRIRNAVFAKAYGDPIAIEKLAESPDNNVRNITNGMLTAAGRVVQIKDGIADGRLHNLDLSQDIAGAMKKLSELRESGQTVQQFLGQMNLFSDELTPLAKDILDAFDKYKRSSKKITGILMAYADVVEAAGDPRQANLFEQVSPTLADVWEAAVRRSEESGSADVQGSLFADPALRGAGPGEGSPQGGGGTQGQGQATRGEVTGQKGGTDAMRGGRPSLMLSGANAPKPVEVVRRRDIVKFLDKSFAPIRTGGFRGIRGALGIFKIREDVIRTKLAEDLPVIAHEVGHHLDHALGLQDKSYDGELLALGRATSPAKADNAYLRKEGVAEFMRLYLTDPAEAQKVAPGYHAAFEWQMEAHPDIHENLLEAQRMVDMWKNQSAKARILGAMSIGEKDPKRPLTFTQLYSRTVDELEPLRKVEEELAAGQKLSTAESPFLTAWLARGWAGKAQAFLNHGILDDDYNKVGPSLKEILKPIEKLDDFRAYLVAKRAQDLLKTRGIPLEKSLGVGFTQADLDQVLADGDGKYATAQKALVQYQDAVLQELVKAGVIDAEGAKAMREANQQYVPFFRVMDPSAGTFNFRGAKKFANLQNPVQRFMGSGRSIVDPLESIIKNTYALLNVAERNKVGRSLVELAEKANGLGRLIEKVDAPQRAVKFQLDRIKGALEDAGVDTDTVDLDQVAMLFEPTGSPSAKNNQITVFRNGKKEFYQVDPEIYRAVLALDSESSNFWMKLFSLPATTLRAGAVLNPDFQASNPLKDQWSAAVFSKYGYVPGYDLAKGLFHAIGKTDLYWKWQAAGGAQASMAALDRSTLQDTLDSMTRRGLTAGAVLRAANPIEILRSISEVMENATRLGEFSRGVAQEGATGEGFRQAALASRDVTVDFGRSGSHTKAVNRLKAFFNAQLQGTDKTIREFKAHPGRTFARATLYYTVGTVLLYLVNRDNPWWQEKNEYEKDAFWFIPLDWSRGLASARESKHFIWIPRAHALGMLFAAGPERILRWIDKEDKRALDGYAMRLVESLSPTSPREAFLPIPTGATPVFEHMANRNFFTNLPIVPLKEQRFEPELQYGNYTSETAKLVGRLGVSPRMFEHDVRSVTGGLGMYGLQVIDQGLIASGVVKIPPRPDRGLAAYPVLKAFLRDAGGPGSGSSVDQFYEVLTKAETMKSSQTQRGKMGIDLRQYTAKEQQLLASLPTLRKVEQTMQDIRGERLRIERAEDVSSEEQRRRIDQLDLEATNLARWVFDKPPISE